MKISIDMIAAAIVLIFMLGSFNDTYSQDQVNNPAVENSIIIIIHGDGDYLFHNKKGESFSADEVALRKAVKVSEQLNNSEVFIFHLKKKNYSLLIFPQNDVDFYFYKNGELKEQASFQRNNFNFSDEADFYKKFASRSSQHLLLYYGHEIPVGDGYGYNSSYTDTQFNLSVFSQAVKKFLHDTKFDLVVLSTCGNGSPSVIKELSPFTNYIIASPSDLHLSYMNPVYLKKLNYFRRYNFEDFVVDFAKSSFRELKKNVETASVISAYKTSKLSKNFLDNFADGENLIKNKSVIVENCDCSEINGFDPGQAKEGVIVLYNPPSFGKEKFKTEHSGWGCKRSTNYTSSSAIDKILESKRDN